jgi:hypothetical protein
MECNEKSPSFINGPEMRRRQAKLKGMAVYRPHVQSFPPFSFALDMGGCLTYSPEKIKTAR